MVVMVGRIGLYARGELSWGFVVLIGGFHGTSWVKGGILWSRMGDFGLMGAVLSKWLWWSRGGIRRCNGG